MKTPNLCLIFAILLLSLPFLNSCLNTPKDITSDISEMNKSMTDAFSNGDMITVLNNYTADAKIFPPNTEVLEGTESLKAFWNNVMNMGIKKIQFETVKAESMGDIAIEEGKYKLLVDGDNVADYGKYLVTWKKEDGKWKISRDIWTTNAPETQHKASVNDTVWIIENHIKASKVAQYEEFNNNILLPAGKELFPKEASTIRMLKSTKQDKAGSITYFYLMDPVLSSSTQTAYDIAYILESKYGKEKAAEYGKMYTDCFADKNSEFIKAIPLY